MLGFHNRVLHINLSQRSFEEESISDEIYTKFLGGKGLATHLLLSNTIQRSLVPPDMEYLSSLL